MKAAATGERIGGEAQDDLDSAIGESALGAVMVASSAIGIVAILTGDDRDALAGRHAFLLSLGRGAKA